MTEHREIRGKKTADFVVSIFIFLIKSGSQTIIFSIPEYARALMHRIFPEVGSSFLLIFR